MLSVTVHEVAPGEFGQTSVAAKLQPIRENEPIRWQHANNEAEAEALLWNFLHSVMIWMSNEGNTQEVISQYLLPLVRSWRGAAAITGCVCGELSTKWDTYGVLQLETSSGVLEFFSDVRPH